MLKNQKLAVGTLPVTDRLLKYLESLNLDYKTVISRSNIAEKGGKKSILSLATFYNILGGQVSRITNRNARKLAKGIQIPVEDLYLIAHGKVKQDEMPQSERLPRQLPVFMAEEIAGAEWRELVAELDIKGKRRQNVAVADDGRDYMVVAFASAAQVFPGSTVSCVAIADNQAEPNPDDLVVIKITRGATCKVLLRRYRKPVRHKSVVLFGFDGSEEISGDDIVWCRRVVELRLGF
jgi:hypothetical protein